jgi:hypothetical protein
MTQPSFINQRVQKDAWPDAWLMAINITTLVKFNPVQNQV